MDWAIEGYQQLGDVLANHSVTLAIEPMNRFKLVFSTLPLMPWRLLSR
jgi:hypothetical protein